MRREDGRAMGMIYEYLIDIEVLIVEENEERGRDRATGFISWNGLEGKGKYGFLKHEVHYHL